MKQLKTGPCREDRSGWIRGLTLIPLALTLLETSAGAMHIAEGMLPKPWAFGWMAVCVPFLAAGLKSIRKTVSDFPRAKILLAMCGAFAFVLSALKIASFSGSCSHPTGVGLSAILFGPAATSVLGDLATYVTTALQLGVVYGNTREYLMIFAVTQIPLAIAEGCLTVVVFNVLEKYSAPQLRELKVLGGRDAT